MGNLKTKYLNVVLPKLNEEFKYENKHNPENNGFGWKTQS